MVHLTTLLTVALASLALAAPNTLSPREKPKKPEKPPGILFKAKTYKSTDCTGKPISKKSVIPEGRCHSFKKDFNTLDLQVENKAAYDITSGDCQIAFFRGKGCVGDPVDGWKEWWVDQNCRHPSSWPQSVQIVCKNSKYVTEDERLERMVDAEQLKKDTENMELWQKQAEKQEKKEQEKEEKERKKNGDDDA